jgi:Lrp/AsnC family leucine-responsive transcriptional regulator
MKDEGALDVLDRRILEVLQEDGRIANNALAQAVGLSPSPCLRRVKRLEELGYIEGYRAVLSRERLGLGTTVLIELKVDILRDSQGDELREAIKDLPEVVAAHFVSGEFDFVLEVVVPDLEQFERFLLERLLKLPMIRDIRSNVVIRSMKLEGPLPLGHVDGG